MGFIAKGRSIAVVEETAFGQGNTVADTDYIDYTSADISADVEQLQRDVIRNSLLNVESVLGQETSSGTIEVEVTPTDSTGAKLNADLLFKNGIGKKLSYVQTNVDDSGSTATTTQFDVDDATGIEVGQVLRVALSTGAEIVQVTDVTGNTLTVQPALSAAPEDDDVVEAALTYILPRPNDAVASLMVREHLADTSGTKLIDYDYKGCMITSVSLTYPVGQICKASFSTTGAGFTIDSNADSISLPCDLVSPVVGKNAKFTYIDSDGVSHSYDAQDVSVKVDTQTTNINAITTDGISKIVGISKTATGSFKMEYTGTDNFEAFKAGDKGTLVLSLNRGGKSDPYVTGLVAPSIKFTKVSKSEDGGILYDNIEFECLSVSCDGNERAASLYFLPNA